MINHYHFLLMRSVSLWNLEIVQSRLHNLCLLLSLPKLIGWKYFWSCIYLITTKTFTENWDSRRHLLELSWPIYSFTKFYSQQMLKISAVVSKWAKRVPTDGALLSQFSGKVLSMIVNRVLKGKNYPVCVLLTQSVRYLGFWLAQHSTYTIVKTYTHSFFPHSMAFGHVYLRKYSIWISLRFFSFKKGNLINSFTGRI